MHVTSEDGIFTYRKALRKPSRAFEGMQLTEAELNEPQVCGVYFMTDPDKVVEVEIEFTDVSCELGGLLGVRRRMPNETNFRIKLFSLEFQFKVCRWLGAEWRILSRRSRSRTESRESRRRVLR